MEPRSMTSDDVSNTGWITATILAIGGAIWSAVSFITGLRSDVKSHAVKLLEHDSRFTRIEDNIAASIERLDNKMDQQHAERMHSGSDIMRALMQLSQGQRITE
jgi:hypothetical protein